VLDLAGEAEPAADGIVLPLKLEHQGGIERIVFRCRIERARFESPSAERPEVLVERVAPLIEREFEYVREQALKSIRSDKKLFEFRINPGPCGPL